MIILYIDTEQTKVNYADYLAIKHNGMSYGSTIEFLDDEAKQAKQDHQAVMNEIMQCEVFGFSNSLNGNKAPTLVLTDLRLHEDGLFQYCKLMAEHGCLVIKAGELESRNVPLEMMNKVLLRFIGLVVAIPKKDIWKPNSATFVCNGEEFVQLPSLDEINTGYNKKEEKWGAWWKNYWEFGKTKDEAVNKLLKDLRKRLTTPQIMP